MNKKIILIVFCVLGLAVGFLFFFGNRGAKESPESGEMAATEDPAAVQEPAAEAESADAESADAEEETAAAPEEETEPEVEESYTDRSDKKDEPEGDIPAAVDNYEVQINENESIEIK